jgi:hypothetical protein
MMKRRTLIASAGVAVLALGAGGIWRVTRMPTTARDPWSLDRISTGDVRLFSFAHAILAPNPHNRQPWLIGLDGDDGAILSCDPKKRLPETDPFDRQITIGFGCFIELARIAAAERGFRVEITTFPDGEPQPRLDMRPVARLRFVRDESITRDPLYHAIARRRSNKDAYDVSRALSAAVANAISEADGWTVDQAQVAALRAVIVDAVTTETKTPRTYLESVRLIRIGYDEIDASPDGIDLSGPFIEGLKLAGQIDHAQLSDEKSMAFQTGLDQLRTTYSSIPALIWVITPNNSRADQLEAGRRYVRANLRATAMGVAMHPMSQSLQEYPEVATAYTRMHNLLGASGSERIQMVARIGYGAPVDPAPRWPLRNHLIA